MLLIGESLKFSIRFKNYVMSVIYVLSLIGIGYLIQKMIGNMLESIDVKLDEFLRSVGGTALYGMNNPQELLQRIGPGAVKTVFAAVKPYTYGFFSVSLLLPIMFGIFLVWARKRLFVGKLTHSAADSLIAFSKVVLLSIVPLLLIYLFFRYQLSSFEKSLINAFINGDADIQLIRYSLYEEMSKAFSPAGYIVLGILSFVYMIVVMPLFCMRFKFKDVLKFELIGKHIRTFGEMSAYCVGFLVAYFLLSYGLKQDAFGSFFIRHAEGIFWTLMILIGVSLLLTKQVLRLFIATAAVLALIAFLYIRSKYFSGYSPLKSIDIPLLKILYSGCFIVFFMGLLFAVIIAVISHLMMQVSYTYANGYVPTEEILYRQYEEERKKIKAAFDQSMDKVRGLEPDFTKGMVQTSGVRNNYFDKQGSSFLEKAPASAPIHSVDIMPAPEPEPEPEPERKTGREALNEALAEVAMSRHNYFEVRNKTMTSSLPSTASSSQQSYYKSEKLISDDESSDTDDKA